MSHATLYAFRQQGDFEAFAEYSNAWHGAMIIWNSMSERYNKPFSLVDLNSMEAVWNLAYDLKVPLHDRITLATTFDRVVAYAGDFQKLVAALRESAKWLPAHCHVSRQVNDIEKIMELNSKCSDIDLHIIGVAWNCTSVVNTWETGEMRIVYETDAYDRKQEYEEEAPYNINVHKRHHNLFEKIK